MRIFDALLFGLFLAVASLHANAVCFVDEKAIGSKTGTSWTNAYTDLQDALLNTTCKEVWVARGVYKPTSGSAITVSFVVVPGVALYGGFGGTETLRDQRDLARNRTILSGDIDNNDANATSSQIDETSADIHGSNSLHVVVMDGTQGKRVTNTTILDGFVITGGNANKNSPQSSALGAGLYCNGSGDGVFAHEYLNECSPSLKNLVFSGNYSLYLGGGVALDSSNLGVSNPTITDASFLGNFSANGGAIGIHQSPGGISNPVFANITVFNNESTDAGGAIRIDAFQGAGTETSVTNATIVGNSSNYGGAFANAGAAHLNLSNVLLWGNAASTQGPDVLDGVGDGAYTTIDHSIVESGCPSGDTCTNLQTADPKLGNPTFFGAALVMMPGRSGAAVDTGSDGTCPSADQRGVARPQGAHCDVGAVERKVNEDVIFKDGFSLF